MGRIEDLQAQIREVVETRRQHFRFIQQEHKRLDRELSKVNLETDARLLWLNRQLDELTPVPANPPVKPPSPKTPKKRRPSRQQMEQWEAEAEELINRVKEIL